MKMKTTLRQSIYTLIFMFGYQKNILLNSLYLIIILDILNINFLGKTMSQKLYKIKQIIKLPYNIFKLTMLLLHLEFPFHVSHL